MISLLVSVYGDRTGEEPRLVAFSPDTGEAEALAVDLPAGAERCMGLAVDEDAVYLLAAADEASHLVCLDAGTLSQKSTVELPGVLDGHSLLVRDGRLYAVSSGTDEVVGFGFEAGRLSGREVVWAASPALQDTHHLNSLTLVEGRLLVSAFGVAPSAARSAPASGYVYDIAAADQIVTGVHHPHTLSPYDGELYFCESRTGRFRTADRTVVTLDGYLRGAAWLPDGRVCLSTSAGRPPDGEPHGETGQCALWIVDPTDGTVAARHPFDRFGPEIYDIALITAH